MRLRTLGLIAGLVVGIGTMAGTSNAQQAGRAWRVGFIGTSPPKTGAPSPMLDAFRNRLQELGYVEGRNIEIEWRWSEGRVERYPAELHIVAQTGVRASER